MKRLKRIATPAIPPQGNLLPRPLRRAGTVTLLLAGCLSWTTACPAETVLTLSDEQIALLGIRFSEVQAADHTAGHRVAATIVNSPLATASAKALFAGMIQEWHAAPGDRLNAGDLIATLQSPDLLNAQNRFITAAADARQAAFERDKNERLFAAGIIAQTRLNQSRQAQVKAQATLAVCRQPLTAAGVSRSQQDALEQGDVPLGVYPLRAPVDSDLAQIHFRTGDYVATNATVATLQSSATAWVQAKIPLALAAPLKIGQPLLLATGERLTLRQKNAVVDRRNQLLTIFAEVDNSAAFYTGQLVTLILPSLQQGVLIPADAVTREHQNARVYVKTGRGISVRNLQLQALGESYLATGDIAPGDTVAVAGTAALKGIELGLGSGD